ncbi:MAG: hypothetical protein ABI647_23035 [Gemmatimonadota bacterium]
MSANVPRRSVLVLSMAVAACQDPRATKAAHDDDLPADTLVTPESQLLGKPADMVVMSDGSLLILDYSRPSILALDSTGSRTLREIGRPGSGPGELRIPIGLAVRGDTVITANVGNGRFEFYLRSGEPLPSRPAPAAALSGRLALNPDGGFILPTNGADSTLARLYGPNSLSSYGIGVPLVPYDPVYRLGPYRAAALRGEVPDYYRNGVLTSLGSDSVVWLAFTTEPMVERLGPGGRSLGRTRIADPALAGIRQRYIARNREDSAGRRVYPLLYMADLKPEAGSGSCSTCRPGRRRSS